MVPGLAAIVCAMTTPQALAQPVYIRSAPLRVTVADAAVTNSTVVTNYVSITGSPGTETLGLSGLPAAYTGYGFNVGSGSASYASLLTINTTNVPDGEYPLTLSVSGAAPATGYLTLQSGRMWTGTTNVSTVWSSAGSWVGGVPPTSSSDVLFTQLGGQTNVLVGGNLFANSEVDQNFTISSLRFSQTNQPNGFHTILIDPGVTLKVNGPLGLRFLADYTAQGLAKGTNAFTGASGTLLVTNESANIADLYDNGGSYHMTDLTGLGTFQTDVNRIGLGDISLYPNDQNIVMVNTYGTSGFVRPQKCLPYWNLARTNIIRAVSVDAYNYENPTNRTYAFTLVKGDLSADSSSLVASLQFGITNSFQLDSILFGGFGGADTQVRFNPAFAATNPIAVFRGVNGGTNRVSVFAVADASGTTTNGSGNTKTPPLDFGANNGRVDAQVDRLFIARDRSGVYASTTAQGTMGLGAGTFDVNTAILGYQEQGNQIAADYAQGILWVSNSAVFKVNKNLTLGYTASSQTDTSLPGDTYGNITVGPVGTLIANSIDIGGLTHNSGLVGGNDAQGKVNSITLTNGATLIVSNNIGSGAYAANPTSTSTAIPGTLGALNMYNSELVVNINGTNTGPYVYVSALNNSGSISNYLKIATISGLTFPAQVPFLHVYNSTPSPSAFTKVLAPSGYQASLLVDTTNANVLDLNIIASTPKNLVWVGPSGSSAGTWDTTSQYWKVIGTSVLTNFDNGDYTTFDDTSSVTNINVSGTVLLIPNNIVVTNNVNYYTFANGGGSLNGGATINKYGTNGLEIDDTTTLSVAVNQGTLLGNGAVGSVAVSAGAVLSYAGTAGSINCSGTGINNGIVNGSVNVSAGGVFTNSFGSSINGTFSAATGGLLYNAGTITYTSGLSSVGTNGWVINTNTINGDLITVNAGGTFEDLGLSGSSTLTSITIAIGGTFIPGANTVARTTIGSDGVGTFPGAVLMAQGSTNIFTIDLGNAQTNSVLVTDHLSFGGSATAQSQNGATLVLNNAGATSFAAGQVFHLFDNVFSTGYPPYSTGTSTNTYPVILPASPGAGLTWDLTHLWSSGNIGVVSASFGPRITNSFAIDGTGTNFVGNFSWDPAYYGFRLQTLVTPSTVGLAPGTNYQWTSISGSWTNLSVSITNVIGATNNLWTNCVFYRLVYP